MSSGSPAAVLLGDVIMRRLNESADVDYIDVSNANGTWFVVVMADGTRVLVDLTV